MRFVEGRDAADIQQYASDPHIVQTCNVPHPYPENGGASFVTWANQSRSNGTGLVFAVLCDATFAGLMTLNDIDLKARTAALDYWIAVPFQGQGIATVAAAEVIAYAFETLGIKTLHSGCLARNPASARVLEKNGFVETGLLHHEGSADGRFAGETVRLFCRNAG